MKYADLVNAVNQIVVGYTMPLTLRQVYYRLVAVGPIANARSNYNQLSSLTVKARESATKLVIKLNYRGDSNYESKPEQ